MARTGPVPAHLDWLGDNAASLPGGGVVEVIAVIAVVAALVAIGAAGVAVSESGEVRRVRRAAERDRADLNRSMTYQSGRTLR